MPRIRLRPRARKDLAGIWDYIADGGEARADSFLDLIGKKLGVLAENPLLGRVRDEVSENLRSWTILRRYVVFYFPLSDGVDVVRVLHGARDIDEVLDDDDLGSLG